jgi:hypothetical protein
MINQLKLNLACGQKPKEGYCNIDYRAIEGVDEVVDLLDFPWPIESDSAEKIICEHFVEHIPHDLTARYLLKHRWDDRRLIPEPDLRDGLLQFMDEVYRILKPEGTIDITTPYYSSEMMWRDPTHCRAITDYTFYYFNKKWRDNSGLSHYDIKSNFEVVPHNYELNPIMASKTEEVRMKGMMFNINVVAHITMRLTKI